MAFPPLFAAHAAYAERVKAAMLYCCDLSPPRENRRSGDSRIRGFSLKLTTLSYRSTRKKDFAERFFAKRSGERFRRTVRVIRTVAYGAPPRRRQFERKSV